ncbi:MAG: hypothetical protein MZU91_11820 [Desulfosudis oleivorans]|nr:hypothetical protein [Desulfosudis oleivorans]
MAIVEDGILSELIIETSLQELSRGNIYKAKIVNIEPSLQATFVDYGESRHGFLPFPKSIPITTRPLRTANPGKDAPGPGGYQAQSGSSGSGGEGRKRDERGRADDLHLPGRTLPGPDARFRRRRDFPQDRRGERPQAYQRNRPRFGGP